MVSLFYSRYGWKPFPTWGFEVDVDKVRLEDDQKINRIFNHFFEIPYIKSIYEEYNRGLIGTIVRDTDYWDDHLHWTDKSLGPYVGEEPSLFQLWPEDGYPKAYIRARKGWDNKSVLITECCYLEGYGEATLKFLPKIADFATKNGLKKIAAGLPSQHPIAQWMLSCGGDKVEYKILINFLKRKYKDKVLNGEFIFWATDMF